MGGDRVGGDRMVGVRMVGDRMGGDRIVGDRMVGDRIGVDGIDVERACDERVGGERVGLTARGSFPLVLDNAIGGMKDTWLPSSYEEKKATPGAPMEEVARQRIDVSRPKLPFIPKTNKVSLYDILTK